LVKLKTIGAFVEHAVPPDEEDEAEDVGPPDEPTPVVPPPDDEEDDVAATVEPLPDPVPPPPPVVPTSWMSGKTQLAAPAIIAATAIPSKARVLIRTSEGARR
jgi:hypothetical protein